MNDRLNLRQSVQLGVLTLALLVVAGLGLAALAVKDRLWADQWEIVLLLADASDVPPGTPVRIRGVQAGEVVRLEDPRIASAAGRPAQGVQAGEGVRVEDSATADPAAMVRAIVRLDGRYRGQLFSNAAARVQPVGMLGAKAIAIDPGNPARGALAEPSIIAHSVPDLAAVAEQLTSVACEVGALLKQAREGSGTLARLLNDDALYRELTQAVGQAGAAAARLEQEAAQVHGFVHDGRETLQSIRQNTDALARLPVVRSYVEDAARLLVRPECRREVHNYAPADLFEPGTAILHDTGRRHLAHLAALFRNDSAKFDIVVAAFADPTDASLTARAAQELTRKQAEAAMEYLRELGAHRTGFFSRNHGLASIGLGMNPSPLIEQLPPSRLTVYVFK